MSFARNFLTSSLSFGGKFLSRSCSSRFALSFISMSNRAFHSMNDAGVTFVPAVLIATAFESEEEEVGGDELGAKSA